MSTPIRTQSPAHTTLETKRHQWKAASARYYENHPEVREKKRLKMAEQRAAKKLARRRWDPPRRSKSSGCFEAGLSAEEGENCQVTSLSRDVNWDRAVPALSRENAAECLLIFHKQDADTIPAPCVLSLETTAESLLSVHSPHANTIRDVFRPGVFQSTQSGEAGKSSESRRRDSPKPDIWVRLAPDYDSSDDD
ncbi:hypothetical protein B0H13DRAFT_2342934 [Mycena leptocephala]|nr:hypothetical protein B0H13DRAFT_2342934 [Mycena leptocephala]